MRCTRHCPALHAAGTLGCPPFPLQATRCFDGNEANGVLKRGRFEELQAQGWKESACLAINEHTLHRVHHDSRAALLLARLARAIA